jgi:hypothetical protein
MDLWAVGSVARSMGGGDRKPHGPDGPWSTGTVGVIPAWHRGVLAARFILFGLVAAQLADAISFTVGVSRFGIHLESNGFAAVLFHAGGLGSVLMVKGAVIVGLVAVLTAFAGRFPRLLMWAGATATSFGLVGFLANTTSIALLS